MKAFFEKDNYTEQDINDLITNQSEESLYLDFKRSDSLGSSPAQKSEISKDVTSFANTDGGIIIYGMEEQGHIASSISYVDGNIYTKEWIENIIISNLQPRLEKFEIFPIRFGGLISQSVYIIKIPFSSNSPHQAKDKKYYKRYNFQSIPMEEYEIKRLYNQSKKTKLRIGKCLHSVKFFPTLSYDPVTLYIIRFQIENIGQTIEKTFKLEIAIPGKIIYNGYTSGQNPIEQYFVRNENSKNIYSIPNKSPIFQSELTTIGEVFISIKKNEIPTIKDCTFDFKLYYSSNTEEKTIPLQSILPLTDN